MAKGIKIMLPATAFGLLMASLMIVDPVHDWLVSSRNFIACYDTIHFPAKCITRFLVAALHPHDDSFMFHAVSIIFQWVGIGLLVWLLVSLKPLLGNRNSPGR